VREQFAQNFLTYARRVFNEMTSFFERLPLPDVAWHFEESALRY
jgi:hypothetical protein